MRKLYTSLFRIATMLICGSALTINAQIVETHSITCSGASDGQLVVTTNFGSEPYNYLWSTGDTTQTVKSLSAGDYSVNIKCSDTITARFDSLTTKIDTVKAIVADTVQVPDTTGGFVDSIAFRDTIYYIENKIPVLYDSTYTIDYDTTFYYTLKDAEPISNIFGITPNTVWNDENNGLIEITTQGGMGKYEYALTDSVMNHAFALQSANTFDKLAPGTYYLTTSDKNGCLAFDTIAVPDDSSVAPKFTVDSFACYKAIDAQMKVEIDTAVTPISSILFPVKLYFDDEMFKELIGYMNYSKSMSHADSTTYYTGSDTLKVDGIKGGSSIYLEKITIGQQEVIDHIDSIPVDTLEDGTIIFEYDTLWKTVNLDLANLVNLTKDFGEGYHTLRLVTADGKGFRHRWYVNAPETPGSINFATTNNACYGGKKGALSFAISGSYDKYLWQISGPANCFGTGRSTAAGTATTGTALTEKGNELSASGLISGKYTITAYNIDPDDSTSVATATYVSMNSNSKCKYVQTIYIDEPDEPIRINYGTIKDALCEANSGAINISRIDGAQGNTNLIWTLNALDGDTIDTDTMAISHLGEGLYYIKVTDSKSCTITDTVRIVAKEKNENMKIEFGEIQHAVCTNNNGFVRIISVSGAEYPISYEWSNGERTKDIYSLYAGTYTVKVKDSYGCETEDSMIVKNIDAVIPLNIFIKEKKDVVCTVENGEILLGKVTGGTKPYKYEWSNGETTESIRSLGVGTYILTVTDADGCTEADSIDIIRTNVPIRINFGSVRHVKCPFVPDGEIAIYDIENAITPISYKWSNGDTTDVAKGLAPGKYTVEVIDGNGCTTKDSITIHAEKQNCIYNIVTPNGDGYNDYLDLSDLCVAAQMEAQVFNENGRLVATLTEEKPKWDPNDDKTTPPTGSTSVYTVFIKLMKDGKDIAKMGESITVIYEK